jgi:hypothetical protein
MGKLDRLFHLYPYIIRRLAFINEIYSKDQTWILLVAVKYDAPLLLRDIAPVGEPAKEKICNTTSLSHVLTVVTSLSVWVLHQCFLNSTKFLNKASVYLYSANLSLIIALSTGLKVTTATNQLS